MIVGYPYEGKSCVAAYDSNGDRVPIEVTAACGMQAMKIFTDLYLGIF